MTVRTVTLDDATGLLSAAVAAGAVPYVADVGDGSPGPHPVTHGLGTRNWLALVFRNAGHIANNGSGERIYVDVVPTGLNTASIETTETWATDQYRLVVLPVGGDDVTGPASGGVLSSTDVTDTTVSVALASIPGDATLIEWRQDGVVVATTAVSTTTHDYDGLTAGIEYDFDTQLYDLYGNPSSLSNTVTETTDAVADTEDPTPGTASLSSTTTTSITYTFTAGSDNVGVTQVNAHDAVGTLLDDNVTSPWERGSLTEATEYGTFFRYYDAAGNSADSNTVTESTDSSAPAIAFVDVVGEKTTSSLSAMPTHASGNTLIMGAYRDGFTTPPALGGDFVDITSGGGNSNAMRAGSLVADSSSEVSGTWTNTTTLQCASYSGVVSIGASATNTGTTDPITVPSLTLQNTDGTSWVVVIIGHRSGANSLATGLSGMTYRGGYEGSGTEQDSAIWDTNGGVSSFAGGTLAYATTSGWFVIVVELKVT